MRWLNYGIPFTFPYKYRLIDGKHRWIQVIAHIQAHWSNRRTIAYTAPDRVGKVIKVTFPGGTYIALGCPLCKAEEAGNNVPGRGKDIPGIMKQNTAQVISREGKGQRWCSQLKIVQKHTFAADWKASLEITWAGLIEREAAMGIVAS